MSGSAALPGVAGFSSIPQTNVACSSIGADSRSMVLLLESRREYLAANDPVHLPRRPLADELPQEAVMGPRSAGTMGSGARIHRPARPERGARAPAIRRRLVAVWIGPPALAHLRPLRSTGTNEEGPRPPAPQPGAGQRGSRWRASCSPTRNREEEPVRSHRCDTASPHVDQDNPARRTILRPCRCCSFSN